MKHDTVFVRLDGDESLKMCALHDVFTISPSTFPVTPVSTDSFWPIQLQFKYTDAKPRQTTSQTEPLKLFQCSRLSELH